MRIVKAIGKKYDKETRAFETVEVEGYFHGWGVDYEELESGAGNYTVGLIEDMKGKMHMFQPEEITFLTPILKKANT